MNCSNIEQELTAYLDGELGENAAAEVRDHLERCPACSVLLQQLEQAEKALDKIPEIEPSGGFTASVMRRVQTGPEPAMTRLSLVRKLALVAGAAVILVAVAIWLAAPSEELTPAEHEIVQNLEVLENLDILEDMDILTELELLLEFEEEDFESS